MNLCIFLIILWYLKIYLHSIDKHNVGMALLIYRPYMIIIHIILLFQFNYIIENIQKNNFTNIIYIILSIIYINLCLLFTPKYETDMYIKKNVNCKFNENIKIALLFTCYNVNKSKQKLSEDVISYYLKNVKDVDIYVVDSAGKGIDYRIIKKSNQIIFTQPNNIKDSTRGELLSLYKAGNKIDFSKYDYVFKITAKYKLHNIINVIKDTVCNTNLVVQYSSIVDFFGGRLFSFYQQCEIVGFKGSYFNKGIECLKNFPGLMENKLSMLCMSENYVRMSKLKNLSNYSRSDNSILNFL